MYCHHDGIRDEREFQYGALILPLNKEEALWPATDEEEAETEVPQAASD